MNYYISDLHFGHANAIKFDARHSRRTSWHIYGHIHSSRNRTYEFMRTLDRALNAGAPVNGYRPSTFDELMENNRRFNAAAGMRGSITEECT